MTVYPVIFIEDPVANDYTSLVSKVLELNLAINRLDIFIKKPFDDSVQLNEVLSKYYNYTRETAVANSFDYRFDINILFNREFKPDTSWNLIYKLKLEQLETNARVIDIDVAVEKTLVLKGGKSCQFYATAAVGGTFDHIHDGHKILLSVALFLTDKTLIVGITGSKLLVNKKHAEALESYGIRQAKVIQFLRLILFDPNVSYNLYEINDVCGPTGYVRDINTLVVSGETIKGGDFVNKYRQDHEFHQLDLEVINVIGSHESSESNNWQGKTSSTEIRQQELDRKSQT